MTYQDDPRRLDAKAVPVERLVERLQILGLRQQSGELIGPCPVCSISPRDDRFGIKIADGVFNCRKCDLRGGDQIALVMQVLSKDFRDALTWICGDKPADIDAKELERRRVAHEKVQRENDVIARRKRQKAINDARKIWHDARDGNLGIVPAYLQARGIDMARLGRVPADLRFIVDHPYVRYVGGNFETMHRGPAMIAAIRNMAGEVTAVHQTWVDIEPPHGKAKISFNGEKFSTKLVRGRKKSCAIMLWSSPNPTTLVMGEGIETTLTATIAAHYPNAAYWAGVDLGNMGGITKKGKGMKFAGIPDMTDKDAFVPPEWVKTLIYIMDGDSEPKFTRAKLLSGLRRAMAYRPGLATKIVHAGDGVDLNDVLVSS